MSTAACARRPRAPPFLDPPGYARHWPEATLLYQLVDAGASRTHGFGVTELASRGQTQVKAHGRRVAVRGEGRPWGAYAAVMRGGQAVDERDRRSALMKKGCASRRTCMHS